MLFVNCLWVVCGLFVSAICEICSGSLFSSLVGVCMRLCGRGVVGFVYKWGLCISGVMCVRR